MLLISLLALLCYTIQVVALDPASSSPALPSQTGTITTLPAAQPSGSDKNPCAFKDRPELLDRVVNDWQGYNISLLVQTCPGVCVFIYGDGNPDVSGIGVSALCRYGVSVTKTSKVMISYVVQFVSTLLAGPILLYSVVFERMNKSAHTTGLAQFLSMVVHDVMPEINTGNVWITVAIMLASCVRLSQGPPVFETDFIGSLLWLQYLMVIARTVSTAVLSRLFPSANVGNLPWSFAFAFFGFYFTLIASLSATGAIGTAQHEALFAISRFCAFEDDLPILPPVDEKKKDNTDLPWWQEVLIRIAAPFIQMGVVLVISLILLIVGAVLSAFYGIGAAIGIRLWGLCSTRLQKLLKIVAAWLPAILWVLLLLIPLVLWFSCCVLLLSTLQGYRSSMELALGKHYQDTYWGFGQVTIVVMLVPSMISVLRKIISKVHPARVPPSTDLPSSEFRPVKVETAEGHELSPILSGEPADGPHEDETPTAIESNFSDQVERPDIGGQRMEESSGGPSRLPDASTAQGISSQSASVPHEESFQLKQRVSTFPKDEEGNILPMHRTG